MTTFYCEYQQVIILLTSVFVTDWTVPKALRVAPNGSNGNEPVDLFSHPEDMRDPWEHRLTDERPRRENQRELRCY